MKPSPTAPNATAMKAVATRTSASVKPRWPGQSFATEPPGSAEPNEDSGPPATRAGESGKTGHMSTEPRPASGRIVRMPSDRSERKLEIVTEVPDKAMVVFAHPDDAEIGSGGVVAKWIAAGCEV